MPAAPLLSADDIKKNLADVPEWAHKPDEKLIERKMVFKDFREAVGFLVRLAFEAEEMDHHPEIALSYKRLTLQLTTHASKGLTEKDFQLAKKIDSLIPG